MGQTKEEIMEMFTEYIREHQQDFYRLAYGYVREREETLDIIQNAICKAITKLNTLHHLEYMKTWFYRILVNECINSIRKNKPFILVAEPQECPDETDMEGKIILNEAVAQLEPNLKSVIMLRFYEDMKIREIAGVMNRKESTIKTWLYQGLKELRIIMGEA